MKKMLKILIILFITLTVMAVIALSFFDPNVLKPRIQALAEQQQLALTMDGDISWTLWPNIGVEINQVKLAPSLQPKLTIAQFEKAQLLLALTPLFKGVFNVHHIIISGAEFNLDIDQQGVANWEDLINNKTETSNNEKNNNLSKKNGESDTSLLLAVDKISLEKSILSFSDQQTGQHIHAEKIALHIQQFNLSGNPFNVQLSMNMEMRNNETANKPLSLALKLSQIIQTSESMDTVSLSDGRLQVTDVNNPKSLIDLGYILKISGLNETNDNSLKYQGELNTSSFNLKNLLSYLGSEITTAQQYALSDISLSSSFDGNDKQIQLNPLNIQLDKTLLKGSIAITDISRGDIAIKLKGDQINIDHYLPPTPETNAIKKPTKQLSTNTKSTGDEPLIPLDTLKSLNGLLKLELKKVTINKLQLQNININAKAKEGLLILKKANASAYDGTIVSRGRLDARGSQAIIKLESQIDQLQLEPILTALSLNNELDLAGRLNANVNATTRGVSSNELFDALTSKITFDGAQVRFSPLNIEKKFCQAVALLTKTEDPVKQWGKFTQMQELKGGITLAKRVVTIDSFNASVEQLMLGSQGSIDLLENRYDLRLPLTLRAPTKSSLNQDEDIIAATSTQGCQISNNYWLNRSLSLVHCSGSLLELDPIKDCRPDKQALTDLGKDYAEYKLKKKHGDKIEEEKQRLFKKLDEKLGDGNSSAKDLLKDLFKR